MSDQNLATEIVKFFYLDVQHGGPNQKVKTIHEFCTYKPEWITDLHVPDVIRLCVALEKEGYLISCSSNNPHPVLGRAYLAVHFRKDIADYGEYEFAAHGFYRIRNHFEKSVKAVVVQREDGNDDIGTSFLWGNSRTLITARHVIRSKKVVRITGNNNKPICLSKLLVPQDKGLDIAMMLVDEDAMRGLPYFRFRPAVVLDEVLCMGYPPIPCFDALQISDLASINARLKASSGNIVAEGSSYVEGQEYLLINARVKGGNSGGPIINRKGYAVGMLVNVPLNLQDSTRIDELGYGVATPHQTFVDVFPRKGCQFGQLVDMPFRNLDDGGFSTLTT